MSDSLAVRTLLELRKWGVNIYCLCPGARNAEWVTLLAKDPEIKVYYWPEERSAAFFALGIAKSTMQPVAVVTTSGTAAAELLPAVIEAYYSSVPLIALTADRPKHYRGTGAPQSIEQKNLFNGYVELAYDLEGDDAWSLSEWKRRAPLHLNVCFEDPVGKQLPQYLPHFLTNTFPSPDVSNVDLSHVVSFFNQVKQPLVIVGELREEAKEAVISLLLKIGAPTYLEGLSGLREETRLDPIRIRSPDRLLQRASRLDYQVDGVLRIGGVPVLRLWRDLETIYRHLPIVSLSEGNFTGIPHGFVIHGPLRIIASIVEEKLRFAGGSFERWQRSDRSLWASSLACLHEEPSSEQGWVHRLSCTMQKNALVYLGNSLPIRHWDSFATHEERNYSVYGNRGANGIDGQIASFLGVSLCKSYNWAIIGDLTALYDFAGLWITPQLTDGYYRIVVINNGGGRIFEQIFHNDAFLNRHSLSFSDFASFWEWKYICLDQDKEIHCSTASFELIEICPDSLATGRFLKNIALILA